MNYSIITLPALFLATLCVSGCVPVERMAPPVDAKMVQTDTSPSIDTLQRGRSIYINQCARCHTVRRVDNYSMPDWDKEILPDMAKRSKLTSTQRDDLRAYIAAAHQAMAGK